MPRGEWTRQVARAARPLAKTLVKSLGQSPVRRLIHRAERWPPARVVRQLGARLGHAWRAFRQTPAMPPAEAHAAPARRQRPKRGQKHR